MVKISLFIFMFNKKSSRFYEYVYKSAVETKIHFVETNYFEHTYRNRVRWSWLTSIRYVWWEGEYEVLNDDDMSDRRSKLLSFSIEGVDTWDVNYMWTIILFILWSVWCMVGHVYACGQKVFILLRFLLTHQSFRFGDFITYTYTPGK